MITKDNLMDNEAATRIRLEIEKLISSYKALRDSKTEKGLKDISEANVRALRLRIQDNSMRKFILYSLKDTAPGKLGSGNILEQLQKLKLPRLVTNGEGNRRAIEELMSPFLVEVAKKEGLEREIKEIDDAIDKKVYALYGLTDEEIKIIEEQCKK